ncbi:ATP-binding protein [Dactylosporangium darangshiense]|uniref:ATP-binding protein n=1 Tax=Dactylosporangium darangshiense TaxID=579108 RepID=UPI00362C0665
MILLTTSTFGRDRELAVLRRAVSGAAEGFGGCTVVTGPAGIGKSHLMQVATQCAGKRGVAIAARAAFELDRAAPLITLASALQQLRPAQPAIGWLRDDDAQYRTLERLGAALEDYAAVRPSSSRSTTRSGWTSCPPWPSPSSCPPSRPRPCGGSSHTGPRRPARPGSSSWSGSCATGTSTSRWAPSTTRRCAGCAPRSSAPTSTTPCWPWPAAATATRCRSSSWSGPCT